MRKRDSKVNVNKSSYSKDIPSANTSIMLIIQINI